MDEAEKYKQRLEAIAEKRRLQEEEDKARREMEDEKLRLQQLKRKSLRDQWLMEGAPLSPTSLDAQAPRSPSWDTHEQTLKKDTDKSQSAEEQQKLEELTEEAVNVAEEMVQGVVQNGQTSNGSGVHEETAEGKVKVDPRPAPDETAVSSVNGNLEPNTNHSASVQNSQSTTNGPIGITAAVGDMKLDQQSSVDEPEPGPAPSDNINEEEEEEEEEEGTLVMRAECIIITDEGDDASQEDHPDDIQHQDETPLLNAEEEEAVVVKTKTPADSERDEAAELVTEAQPAAGGGDVEGSVKLITNGEETVEDEDIQVGSTACVQLQSSAGAPEGTAVALVPVYSEGQPSTPSAVPQAEGEASAAPEGAEAALQAAELICQPGQFQDVSLADPQENNRTEEGPREQEPLLLESTVPRTTAEPAGIPGPASTETQSPPPRAQGQADEAKAPKRKTCQCCSVM